jgi:hypothetical protein
MGVIMMTDEQGFCYCPQSEDFFYWPPEEIFQYHNWCEVSKAQHKRRLQRVTDKAGLETELKR